VKAIQVQNYEALPVPADHRQRTVRLFNEHSKGILTEQTVRAYLAAIKAGEIRRKDGGRLKPNSVVSYVVGLKSAIKENSDSIELHRKLDLLFKKAAPSVSKSIDRDETLTPAELQRLEAEGTPKLKATFRFLALTGLRISEALAIELSDCAIHSDRVKIAVTGKGNKSRKVTVPRKVFESVREAFQSKTFLFQNHHHRSRQGRYTRERFWQLISEHSENTIGRRIHPHTLRHANATTLLAMGFTLKQVADHLGHARVGTTAQIYDQNRMDFDSIMNLQAVFDGKATKQRRKRTA
jgi:site-specific recombinase XerD